MSDLEKTHSDRRQELERQIEELEWQRLREFKVIQMKLIPLWIVAFLVVVLITSLSHSPALTGWNMVAIVGIVAAVYLLAFSIAARNKAKIKAEISEKRAQLEVEFENKS
jgi:Flp pilus assembly protein TadB